MLRRNKIIATTLAILAVMQGVPMAQAKAAVTATANATVASSYPSVNVSGLGNVEYFAYSGYDGSSSLWGNTNFQSIDVSSDSDKHQSGTHSYDYYCVLGAIPNATVRFSRSVSNGDSMYMCFDGQAQRIVDNIGGNYAGASISFVMPNTTKQKLTFHIEERDGDDITYHYTLVPLTQIEAGNPASEQASLLQQALLNYRISNSTTLQDLQTLVNNNIDRSKFSAVVNQTDRSVSTESSDGNFAGNVVVTELSSGKQSAPTFNIIIPKMSQSLSTIGTSLTNFCQNYNATNNSKQTDFQNAVKITNSDYSVTVSNWGLSPATDTTEGALSCNVNINQNGKVVQTIPINNKKIAKLATTTATAKNIIENIVKDYQATNNSDPNDLLTTLKKAVGNNIDVKIENWKLDQSTETKKGLLKASVSITDGTTKDSVPIEKEIDVQEQSVGTVKSSFETTLSNFKGKNDTKAEDILNTIKITNEDIKVDISDFEIVPANEGKSGKVKGNVNIKNDSTEETETVPIDIKIAQLPQSAETVKSLYEKAVKNYVAINDTKPEDFLNLIYINNEDISVSMEDDYSIKYADDKEKGAIKGTIKIYDKSTETTEEVPIDKEIASLSQSLSTSIKLVQDVIYGYNPTNDSTFDNLLIKCNNVVTQNIDVYYKIGEQPEKVDSTEFDEGYMKATMVITDGTDSIELPFNITIAKTPQTVSGAKTLIEACLKNFKAKNDTTPQMVLNAVETNIRSNDIHVEFGTGEGEPFSKENATEFKAGQIKGVINVSDSNDTIKVPVELKIDQLPQTIDQAEESLNISLPNFIINNDTEENDIKKQIEDVVSSNIFVTTEGFEKRKATLDTEGEIKVKVILLDKTTTQTKEIQLTLTINKLKESLEDATKAVEKAEQSKSQEDLDAAQKEVNRLPDGQDKTDLQNRIDAVQKIIDAANAVKHAEETKNQSDVDQAQKDIDKLPNGKDKDDLQKQLDQVQNEITKELQDIKNNIEVILGNITVSNDTTEKDIINAIKSNISNNNITVAFGTGDGEPFKKEVADYSKAGKITGVIYASNGDKSVSNQINLEIAQLTNNSTGGSGSSGGSSGSSSSSHHHHHDDGTNLTNPQSNENSNETTGLKYVNGHWHYFNSDGTMYTGWKEMEGLWYYFDTNGILKTGWFLDTDGHWYYLSEEQGLYLGSMQTGWKYINGQWYYLNIEHGKPLGSMALGWVNDNGTWYYLSSNGSMKTGWVNDNETWYYLSSSGSMKTGWLNDNGTWYYLSSNGSMKTGWFEDADGKWYYLQSSGAMAYDTYVDGYYLDNTGAWVK